MLTCIAGGHVIDPANQRDGQGDIWIRDGRIIDKPNKKPDATYHAAGKIVMAGAIDVHSHIAGWNVDTARLLLPEYQSAAARLRAGETSLLTKGWSALETGQLYATMGFTTVVEPAVSPHYALHAHLELVDTPIIDKATLAVLGNDDYLLRLLHDNESEQAIEDYVAWILETSRSLGIKVVNAGGVAAFKDNVRAFSFDDVVPAFGLTSRRIVKALQRAVSNLGVPHPLHVHCNNLGLAGNFETALTRIAASSRAFAVLRLWQRGQPRILLRRSSACRSRKQKGERNH